MGLIENLLAGATGYAVSEMSRSHTLRDAIDERINRSKQKVTLLDLIDEYARQHGIYTQDNKRLIICTRLQLDTRSMITRICMIEGKLYS